MFGVLVAMWSNKLKLIIVIQVIRMILNKDNIDACKTENGGFTKAQLEIMDLGWPVHRGRLYGELVGRDVSDETYDAFMDARVTNALKKRVRADGSEYRGKSPRKKRKGKKSAYSQEQLIDLVHLEEINVFDTETSGGTNAINRIVQISATIMNPMYNPDSISYKEELRNAMVNPECPITYYASTIHGFKDRDVIDKPVFANVIDSIMNRIPHNSILLAHSAECDMRLLYLESLRLGDEHLEWFESLSVIDSIKVAKDLYPEHKKHGLDALSERLEVVIEDKMRHDARGDVLGLAECWGKMVQEVLAGNLPYSQHMIPVKSMDIINHEKIKADYEAGIGKSQAKPQRSLFVR